MLVPLSVRMFAAPKDCPGSWGCSGYSGSSGEISPPPPPPPPRPSTHAEVMFSPGAKMSTQLPKLENDARASVLVVAPTVMADGVLAGDTLQAFSFELPAATTSVTP